MQGRTAEETGTSWTIRTSESRSLLLIWFVDVHSAKPSVLEAEAALWNSLWSFAFRHCCKTDFWVFFQTQALPQQTVAKTFNPTRHAVPLPACHNKMKKTKQKKSLFRVLMRYQMGFQHVALGCTESASHIACLHGNQQRPI